MGPRAFGLADLEDLNDEGMRECGILFADRGAWARQKEAIVMCAEARCANTTSRQLHTALVQHGIPHSAFVPRTGLHLATPRAEYTDGRPWIERLGNAECGVRNAECCLQIEATARGRKKRLLCVRRRDAPTRQAGDVTLPFCSSVFRILRIRSQNRPPPRGSTRGVHGWSAVDRTIRECGMRNALFADRGDCARQKETIVMCAEARCANTTSRRCHTALLQLGIPHSAFRTPLVPRTGLHLATSRSEYTDGRPTLKRLGDFTLPLCSTAFRIPHSFSIPQLASQTCAHLAP